MHAEVRSDGHRFDLWARRAGPARCCGPRRRRGGRDPRSALGLARPATTGPPGATSSGASRRPSCRSAGDGAPRGSSWPTPIRSDRCCDGAEALPADRRALFTGFVLGDDRGQSVAVADDFQGAGLSPPARGLRGRTWRSCWRWPRRSCAGSGCVAAGWPRWPLVRLFARHDPVRAVGAAGHGHGGDRRSAPGCSAARSSGLRVLALAVTGARAGRPAARRACSASSSRSRPRPGSCVLARPLADHLPGPAAGRRGAGRDPGRPGGGGPAAGRSIRTGCRWPACRPTCWPSRRPGCHGLGPDRRAGGRGGRPAAGRGARTCRPRPCCGGSSGWPAQRAPPHRSARSGSCRWAAPPWPPGAPWRPADGSRRGLARLGWAAMVAVLLFPAVAASGPAPVRTELARAGTLWRAAVAGATVLVLAIDARPGGGARRPASLPASTASTSWWPRPAGRRSRRSSRHPPAGPGRRVWLPRVEGACTGPPSVVGARRPEPDEHQVVGSLLVTVIAVAPTLEVSVALVGSTASAPSTTSRRCEPSRRLSRRAWAPEAGVGSLRAPRARAPPLRRHPPGRRDGHPQPHARLLLRPGHATTTSTTFLRKAEQLVADGADFLDVGGVKAGPGRRGHRGARSSSGWCPAIEALRARFDLPLSVDTWRASVARACFEAGAVVGNDISGFADPDYLPDVRRGRRVGGGHPHPPRASGARSRSASTTTSSSTCAAFLADRAEPRPRRAGIPPERIMVDAGLDLGKTEPQSLELLRGTPTGWPRSATRCSCRPRTSGSSGTSSTSRSHDAAEGTMAAHALGHRPRAAGCCAPTTSAAGRRVADVMAAVLGRRHERPTSTSTAPSTWSRATTPCCSATRCTTWSTALVGDGDRSLMVEELDADRLRGRPGRLLDRPARRRGPDPAVPHRSSRRASAATRRCSPPRTRWRRSSPTSPTRCRPRRWCWSGRRARSPAPGWRPSPRS